VCSSEPGAGRKAKFCNALHNALLPLIGKPITAILWLVSIIVAEIGDKGTAIFSYLQYLKMGKK
jgi:hypothetical protein